MEFQPKVSFGLPVFNGEKYLNEALESILSQTFRDFELIICDNASTDKTEAICKQYVERDSRVRYYRNSTNIGGSQNQKLTIELARGQYFHLGAHDDLLAPDLLAKCVEVLDNDSSVVLCYSMMFEIDEHGKLLGKIEPADLATSPNPDERFSNLLEGHRVDFLYGLIRTDILHKTELEPPYPQSDSIFACELALHGQFRKVPEYLYYRRTHQEACTSLDLYRQLCWYQPTIQNAPQWIILWKIKYYSYFGLFWLETFHFFRIIFRVKLSIKEQIYCLFYATLWLLKRHLIPDSIKRFRQEFKKARRSKFQNNMDMT